MNHRRILIALFACQMAIQFASSALAMYDPGLGRFCSRDPIGYVGSEWGLNDFGDSNPFNSLDPTGLIIVKTGPHGGSLYGGCETLGPSGICVGNGIIPGERNPQKCKTRNSTSICLA